MEEDLKRNDSVKNISELEKKEKHRKRVQIISLVVFALFLVLGTIAAIPIAKELSADLKTNEGIENLTEKFSRYSNKYLGYNRISEDIAIAALKSDAHYRNIAKLMNEDRERYEKEIGVLPGFKVYESVANFILIKYPIELKEALQKAFAEQSYKVKFMNEPDINTHLRITLGRPEQNRIVIDTIKEIASK